MTLPDRYFRILRKKRVRRMLDEAGVKIPDFVLEVIDNPNIRPHSSFINYKKLKKERLAREAAEREALERDTATPPSDTVEGTGTGTAT